MIDDLIFDLSISLNFDFFDFHLDPSIRLHLHFPLSGLWKILRNGYVTVT